MDSLNTDGSGSVTAASYVSGSRAAGTSLSNVSGSWKHVLDSGWDRFTAPLFGGFDGLHIKEREPFNNRVLGTNSNQEANYAYNSLKMAVDMCADPEVIECNMITLPGVTNTGITNHVINTCEARADSLAVIDIENAYTPATENAKSFKERVGSVDSAVNSLRDRALNSSYACAYYPWVRLKDTLNGASLWAPPSVIALGTFASTERNSDLWFAPAGFVRGGLTAGAAGLPVIGVSERLTSKDRDKLYEENVNPIASFPSEGIVVFGQKTLQVTPSALDRINVRRLLIYVKKEISRMATDILFDQNVQQTWARFLARVEPFLNSIRQRFGLTDFRVVLDETTTTAELVDRNIMYAKVYLKPARAIEFIAIDFVVTNTGAAFED